MALTDTTPPLRPLEAVIALPDGSTMQVVGLSVSRATAIGHDMAGHEFLKLES